MSMKKYSLPLLAVLLALVGLGAGCNPSNEGNTNTTAVFEEEEETNGNTSQMNTPDDTEDQDDSNTALEDEPTQDEADIGDTADDSVFEITQDVDELSDFADLIEDAELDELFTDESAQYTLFAPTDEALEPMDEQIDGMRDDEDMTALQNLVKDHTVQGLFAAGDLRDGQELTTLSGKKITVEKKDASITVSGAYISTPDIEGNNGIVHIIDAVLKP
jgi:uncharacterized surface protein with fasciclin (FAS1) repeats